MEEMPISKFRNWIHQTLDRIRRTRKPIRITKFGEPWVEIVPVTHSHKKKGWAGTMIGTGHIAGDIASPTCTEKDWEVLYS
jgi:antitoxin (DNA-binding transcriptional repressor) of toxin-antitoxin stability system